MTSIWDEKGSKAVIFGYTDRFNTSRFLAGDKIVIACDAVFLNKMHDGESLNNNETDTPSDNELWVSGSTEDTNLEANLEGTKTKSQQ